MRFSFSELECYRQCRFKHQLTFLEGWTPETPSPALARGTAFHAILEAHYKAIHLGSTEHTTEEVFAELAIWNRPPVSDLPDDEVALLEWMYAGYLERYGADSDWEVLRTEQKIEVDLGDGVVMGGTIDLVVRHRPSDSIWIVDHKTCKNLPKQRELDLDDQLAIYTWMKRQDEPELKIKGAISNSVRTQRNKAPMQLDERFDRQMTFRNPAELERVVDDARELMLEAYRLLGPEDRPRSPDRDRCGWKCSMVEACIHGRRYGAEKARSFLEDGGFTIKTPHGHETDPRWAK